MNTPSEPDDENKAPLEPGGASEGSVSDASNDENELFDAGGKVDRDAINRQRE